MALVWYNNGFLWYSQLNLSASALGLCNNYMIIALKKITTFVNQTLNCNKMRSNQAEFKEELKQ